MIERIDDMPGGTIGFRANGKRSRLDQAAARGAIMKS